jgi:hypothetical protein
MPRPGHFTPNKDLVPIVQEAGWAPRSVWTGAENLNPLPQLGLDPETVQPVASRYNNWASLAPTPLGNNLKPRILKSL